MTEMVTLPREVVERALDALDLSIPLGSDVHVERALAIEALRTALAAGEAQDEMCDRCDQPIHPGAPCEEVSQMAADRLAAGDPLPNVMLCKVCGADRAREDCRSPDRLRCGFSVVAYAAGETRPAPDAVRRRRECLRCGARWTTYERRAGEDAVYVAAVRLAQAALDSVGVTE